MTGKRVLVIDDEPAMAESLAAVLELSGYEVRLAYTGRTALALAEDFAPAIILCDLHLGEYENGTDVARALRALPALPGVRIIALTGDDRATVAGPGADSPFDDMILKTTSPAVLLDRLAASRPAGA